DEFRLKGIGRVNCITFDVNGTMFVGSASGGAWRKNPGDANSGYTSLTHHIPNLSVSSICVNPENTNEIYLLTGDGDGRHGYCIGVLKSTDGGVSWYQTGFTITTPHFLDAYKMIMLPDAPETMLVACNRGILKTTDGWKTMDTVFSVPGMLFYDLEMHPENSAWIYAANNNKIYKSIDSGSSWELNVELHPGASRTAISICTSQPNVIYALSGVPATAAGVIYKTFNGGVTWDTIATNMDILDGGDGDGGRREQIFYDHTLLVNPDNPDQIWVGAID
ncbi:MAG: WD40/YVTN/BNR-like repeat-containing protein, partial [Chitinophagales bacterium]